MTLTFLLLLLGIVLIIIAIVRKIGALKIAAGILIFFGIIGMILYFTLGSMK